MAVGEAFLTLGDRDAAMQRFPELWTTKMETTSLPV